MSKKIERLWQRLALRSKPRKFRPREYVRAYLERCTGGRERCLILTHWCLSPRLVIRLSQGNNFVPLPRELKVAKDIGEITREFGEAGIPIDWYILMARNFVGHLNLERKSAQSYIAVVDSLIANPEVVVVEHEDFTGFRYSGALYSFQPGLVEREVERRRSMYAQIQKRATEAELYQDSVLNLSAEAEEGEFLVQTFGDFVHVPLVSLERFASMHQLANFRERLLPILPLYPWRAEVLD